MKTLLVYASKKGGTKKCAEQIRKGIAGEVKVADIKHALDGDLDAYDTIVMGSPVYAGSLDKQFKEFCEKNKEILQRKRTFLFLSCMNDNGCNDYTNNNLPKEVIQHLTDIVWCGGAFYFSKMNFFEKFLIKKIANSEMKRKGSTEKIDGKKDIEMFQGKNITRLIKEINQK